MYVLNRFYEFYPLLSTNCFLCLVKCLNTDENYFYSLVSRYWIEGIHVYTYINMLLDKKYWKCRKILWNLFVVRFFLVLSVSIYFQFCFYYSLSNKSIFVFQNVMVKLFLYFQKQDSSIKPWERRKSHGGKDYRAAMTTFNLVPLAFKIEMNNLHQVCAHTLLKS